MNDPRLFFAIERAERMERDLQAREAAAVLLADAQRIGKARIIYYYERPVTPAPADPAQAHAAELETELKNIQEMAAEDIRMGDASGAIWQIEANARALLAKLDAAREAQKAVTK